MFVYKYIHMNIHVAGFHATRDCGLDKPSSNMMQSVLLCDEWSPVEVLFGLVEGLSKDLMLHFARGHKAKA